MLLPNTQLNPAEPATEEPVLEIDDDDDSEFYQFLYIARSSALLGIILHFGKLTCHTFDKPDHNCIIPVFISVTFVHRDHALWQRNPFTNRIWAFTCLFLVLIHGIICFVQLLLEDFWVQLPNQWLALLILFGGSLLSMLVSELAKFQENK